MNVSLFLPRQQRSSKSKLEEITLRGFGGGWNEVDEDTNMEAKFQTALVNFRRTPSGAQKLRFGTRWFADVADQGIGAIVDMDYFNDRLVVPGATGEIVTLTNEAAKEIIWDATIAAALPGAPSTWGPTTQVDFVPWKDQFIIHNGTDRPIIVDAAFDVTYLQDLATGSNVNVPIGKYGCIAANYHCIAGISGSPTTIYISSRGTAGTFPGDPDPNDATSIDVGAFAPSGAPEIIAIAGYRQFLIVFFRGQSLIVKLGVYDDSGNHAPEFIDEMPQFGLLNHRCITGVENDLRFAGFDGLSGANRNLFSGNIDSKFLSALIEPAWRREQATANVADPFVVHDPLAHATYTFTNDEDGTVIVYQANTQLKYESWTKYLGLSFVCGCRSFLGRVFLANRTVGNTRIYQLGNDVFPDEDFGAEFMLDRQGIWANNTLFAAGFIAYDDTDDASFMCLETHTSEMVGLFSFDRLTNPDRWEAYLGERIEFTMELPWIDGRTPMRTKQSKYTSVDARGTAEFTLSVFVDFHRDEPAITLDFVGNDAISGRKSGSPQLYGFPFKFKTMKVLIDGATRDPLTIAGIRFLFSRGRFRR